MSATGLTTRLGLAIAGPVGDALGMPLWFLISGIVTAAMGGGAFFVPAILRTENRGAEAVAAYEEKLQERDHPKGG